MSLVSVAELQRAWRAVAAGQFRADVGDGRRPAAGSRPRTGVPARAQSVGETGLSAAWRPTEPVIAVVGASARVGSSTTALALATAATRSPTTAEGAPGARVLECGPAHRSALAGAATAELGTTAAGWSRGRRGPVVIDRATTPGAQSDQLPLPDEGECQLSASDLYGDARPGVALSVVDVGWDLRTVSGGSWLSRVVSDHPVVIVTVATAPGLRALEQTLAALAPVHPACCVVIGPRRRRWPRQVHATAQDTVSSLTETGQLLVVPSMCGLRVTGPTPAPLPRAVITACGHVLDRVLTHDIPVTTHLKGSDDDDDD